MYTTRIKTIYLTAGLAMAVLAGCTPSKYASQADRDAGRTLDHAERFALGEPRKFQVAYRPFRAEPDRPEDLVVAGKVLPLRGEKLVKLALVEALQIAFRNSREFQTQKEELYSAALALASSRRGWDFPLLGGEVVGSAERSVVNGGPETNSAALSPAAVLTQNLVNGGVLTLGMGMDLVSDLLGWRSTTVGSLFNANFTQPLLQGAWRGLAYEAQYRTERDFVFSVLDYERFTQSFAVTILTRYYSVLSQRDQLENERSNIARLEQTFSLTKTLVKGGVRSPIEQDQAEQNLIDAQVRFQQNLQQYRDSLDRFKLTLGLPLAARMELEYPEGLEELNKIGPKPMPLAESDAVAVAMVTRPDVLRQAAGLRDADRDVEIATDAFLPVLNVTLGISAASRAPRNYTDVQFNRHTRGAGVAFDYPLDQTANRDAYRNAMFARDKARRDYEEFLDQLRLDIRQSYRALEQSRVSYELELRNMEINKRRRKLAVLEQKGGQASARDVLEAEDALRRAQNGVTSALVSYTTTRLQFMTTLGLLDVDEKGQLHERAKPLKFDRLGQRYPYIARP